MLTDAQKEAALARLGWNRFFASQFEAHQGPYRPGRVAVERRGEYLLYTESGEVAATVAGRFRQSAAGREDYPAVGDWALLADRHEEGRALIHGLLPRQSTITRKLAGQTAEAQILAANVDFVFLCMGLDANFNPRRLERYLVVAWESGAIPVVVLTKADLCADLQEKLALVAAVAPGIDVIALSSFAGTGLPALADYLACGKTVAMLGSSGVGKSTLLNRLLGCEKQATQAVREDDGRGRHTTTHRELVPLPGGGLLIDTPGMRELQLPGEGTGLAEAFGEVEALAGACRFRDCRHRAEPGCAVQAALAMGELSRERFDSYLKLQAESAFAERKAARRLAMIARGAKKTPPRERRIAPDHDPVDS